MDRYKQIKNSAQQLPKVSEKALGIFNQAFEKVLSLVDEKFLLESKFIKDYYGDDKLNTVKDVHSNFGYLLLSIYEFNLQQNLIDEFVWYINVLSNRGFDRKYFEKMIKAWDIAIQSVIDSPESHELTKILAFLYNNLNGLLECQKNIENKINEEQQKFLEILIKKRRREAANYILSLQDRGYTLEKLYSEFLPRVMKEVGLLWEKNRITTIDEHVATEICRYVMFRIIDTIEIGRKLPFKALVTCSPNEEHEMGAELLENYLEVKGWTVFFMGHISPHEDIINTIVLNKPDVVFISVSMLSNLPSLKKLALEIKKLIPTIKIIIGGEASVNAGEPLREFSDSTAKTIDEGHKISLKLLGYNA